MYKWLKKLPSTPGLPDPNQKYQPDVQQLTLAANKSIVQATSGDPLSPSRGAKRKRGQSNHYWNHTIGVSGLTFLIY